MKNEYVVHRKAKEYIVEVLELGKTGKIEPHRHIVSHHYVANFVAQVSKQVSKVSKATNGLKAVERQYTAVSKGRKNRSLVNDCDVLVEIDKIILIEQLAQQAIEYNEEVTFASTGSNTKLRLYANLMQGGSFRHYNWVYYYWPLQILEYYGIVKPLDRQTFLINQVKLDKFIKKEKLLTEGSIFEIKPGRVKCL